MTPMRGAQLFLMSIGDSPRTGVSQSFAEPLIDCASQRTPRLSVRLGRMLHESRRNSEWLSVWVCAQKVPVVGFPFMSIGMSEVSKHWLESNAGTPPAPMTGL